METGALVNFERMLCKERLPRLRAARLTCPTLNYTSQISPQPLDRPRETQNPRVRRACIELLARQTGRLAALSGFDYMNAAYIIAAIPLGKATVHWVRLPTLSIFASSPIREALS